jgi:hypothetical protein
MDSFDTILDISELFDPDPLLYTDEGYDSGGESSQSSDDEQCLLVNTDVKWGYAHCRILHNHIIYFVKIL